MKLSDKAFTLIELLFTFSILAFCLCGLLLTYINMYVLSDLSRDLTLVNNAMQAEIETINRMDFDDIDDLNGTTFDITGFSAANAKGRIEVSDLTIRATPTETLRRVRIVTSFRSRGRVIGEDQDLDGQLDAGEDTLIANGRLDSPVEIVTLVVR